ncbi:hypothetical protein OAW_00695 [Vibrio cyclitrophicus ZF170]|uniref:hypothetical protein n=1 Tax=Vibrio cyclitrophicus TaxID=47951 RepID=UPI0002E5925E|nr:hypothetical protein [Vibrio cyclitrophicus]OEE24990.1 hypothetical protein OAW_00695 [Vibrio cyclitrophicus ZF170]
MSHTVNFDQRIRFNQEEADIINDAFEAIAECGGTPPSPNAFAKRGAVSKMNKILKDNKKK